MENDKSLYMKLVAFWKKETVLSIAIILAVLSAFWVHPNKEYIGYIDWRTLGILLSLMIIMEGFKGTGLFDEIGARLLKYTKKLWQLILVLVFLCFFFSMLITNDVALLTFVPFTVMVLESCNQREAMIPTIILQTVAANLGSMMTPVGNPQNLYLFTIMGCNIVDFMKVLLPYTTITFVLLLISVLLIKNKNASVSAREVMNSERKENVKYKNLAYAILFVLSIMVVMRVFSYMILITLVVLVVVVMDYKTLKTVDYALIFTFIAFFILIGNLGNIEYIRKTLSNIVETREVYVAILSSQFISNVPATLLLSGFTNNYRELLIGVNLGGLGTFIASMASLISYKIYAHNYNESKGEYLIKFTITNVIYLVILIIGYILIG